MASLPLKARPLTEDLLFLRKFPPFRRLLRVLLLRTLPPCRRLLWVLLLLAVLLPSGCGEGDADPGVERVEGGDTVFVHSLRPAVPDTLFPRETARIGLADGPLEYIFNLIYTFTVGPSGDVFVHDEGEGIRHFDAQGQYLGHLAREGEGPEEVRFATGLAASEWGAVAAYDLGNQRVSILEPDGTVQTHRRPLGRPPYDEDAILFHNDGSLWVGIVPPWSSDGDIPHPRPSFARVTNSGSFVDTVWTPASLGENCPMLSDRMNSGGFWEDKRDPYFPKAKWSLGPDGTLAFGCPVDYSFDLLPPAGGVIRISRPWTPVFMPEEQKDFFVKWGVLTRVPSDPLPAYARINLPGDGRIWVWPTQPSKRVLLSERMQESFGETHTWSVSWSGAFDVFEDTGEWLAVVKLPEEARYSGFPNEPTVLIRGDTLWAVAVDSMEVQYVVRYEVDGLSGG